MTPASAPDTRQYPIGLWDGRDTYSPDERRLLIDQLRALPARYREETESLTDAELARQYRPGSWTVRQLVHHVADTHQWHFFRVKQTLAQPEKTTGIFGNVNAWAAGPDVTKTPIASSLMILDGTHQRWAYLCDALSDADWERVYYHPGRQRDLTLAQALAIAVWHGQHHLAHIKLARQRT